jgi:mannitol-specific phosphotransferase system IIBC component
MMALKYNPEISLGNILQMLTIAVSVFSAYLLLVTTDTKHTAQLEQHTKQIAEIKDFNKEVNQYFKIIELKLTEIQIEQARRGR